MPRSAQPARRPAGPASARGTSSAPSIPPPGAPALRRAPGRGLSVALALATVAVTGIGGACGRRGAAGDAPRPASSAEEGPSTLPAGFSPDAGANPRAAVAAVDVEAREVAASVTLAEAKGCDPQTSDIATYLKDVDLALGGRPGELATSWILRVGSKTQVGFAGFDLKARRISRPRAVGPGASRPPRLFPSGGAADEWHLLFFDTEGLAHVRPRADALPAPEIEHLPGVSPADADDVGLAEAPSGGVAVVAPFGEARDKLGVFLLGGADAQPSGVTVVAVTRGAKKPRRPAVAVAADGYFVAWTDEGDVLWATRFDRGGKEGEAQVLGGPAPGREGLALVPLERGALAVWREGDRVIARSLDSEAKPASRPRALGHGSWVGALPAEGGAVVAWIGDRGDLAGQLVAARVSREAEPAKSALRLLDAGRSLEGQGTPVLASAGGRLAFGWTEPMSAVVSTKRAVLRTIDATCLPR